MFDKGTCIISEAFIFISSKIYRGHFSTNKRVVEAACCRFHFPNSLFQKMYLGKIHKLSLSCLSLLKSQLFIPIKP